MISAPPFQLYLWSHRVLYLGLGPDNELHQHHAAQICMSLGANPLRYRSSNSSDWIEAQGVVIPPDHPHQIETGVNRVLALYVEPDSDDYPLNIKKGDIRQLKIRGNEVAAFADRLAACNDANLAWNLSVSKLNIDIDRISKVRDSRVGTVIETIRGNPGDSYTAQELASSVQLSASRLSHIFKRHVGVPIRRFIVWSRLRTVVEHASQGSTLTDAALAAGFADAAHMSNSFHRMFGFAPSALFASDVAREVILINNEFSD